MILQKKSHFPPTHTHAKFGNLTFMQLMEFFMLITILESNYEIFEITIQLLNFYDWEILIEKLVFRALISFLSNFDNKWPKVIFYALQD